MTQIITWTHVDRLVRDMYDERGMLPVGATDAEVAHAFIKWQEKQRGIVLRDLEERDREIVQLRYQLEAMKAKPLRKTKERLAEIEENIDFIRRHLGLVL